jgi:hypothetical protein
LIIINENWTHARIDDFKEALITCVFLFSSGRNIKMVKSDKTKVKIVCKEGVTDLQ